MEFYFMAVETSARAHDLDPAVGHLPTAELGRETKSPTLSEQFLNCRRKVGFPILHRI